MKGLTLTIAMALMGAGLAACAPRIGATHYERWASQDAKRKAEAAEEAKKEATAVAPAKAPAAAAKPVSAAPAPPRPPGDSYNSLSDETPPVRTATKSKSRVVKPADEDDIY